MTNVFESLIEKAGIEILNKEGVAKIASYAADNVGIENAMELILNGPQAILIDKNILKEYIKKEKSKSDITVIKYDINYVSKKILVDYRYDAKRYFKNEDETYWYNGSDKKSDEYPFEKIITRTDYIHIDFDQYLSF